MLHANVYSAVVAVGCCYAPVSCTSADSFPACAYHSFSYSVLTGS